MSQSRFENSSSEAGKSVGKLVAIGVIALLGVILLFECVGYNSGGYRTVIESRVTGSLSVKFGNGFYFTLFGKTTTYPDVLTVSFTKDDTKSTIDVPPISIRFNDATSADATGVVKFNLPKDEAKMIQMHRDYRSVENLGLTGFKPFVMECLKNSSQLMSSEMHYLGGRSQMSQYFQDQLNDGVYLLSTEEKVVRDTIDKENKRLYFTKIRTDKDGQFVRKRSMLEQYNVTITDAVVSDVDYEARVDSLLGQKIDATSRTSISKQKLMQAQQEAQTAKAQGEKTLVETEYKEKQNQTTQVIQAETGVKLAEQQVRLQEQEKLKQKASYEASIYEAKRTREIADGEAYAKKAVMVADGALEKKINALVEINKNYAEALGKQPVVPSIIIGNQGQNGVTNSSDMMQVMYLQSLRQLKMDMEVQKKGGQ